METYSVYVHRTPDDRYYVGMTSNIKKRFGKTRYRQTALESHINAYGWDNIEHIVALNTEDKEKALKTEDMLILMYNKLGKLINKHRSGLIWSSDKAAYERNKRHYNADYNEKILESGKLSKRIAYARPEGKIYNRVNWFNRRYPDKAIETALEAKRKYLESGYIPTYIKHDDIG